MYTFTYNPATRGEEEITPEGDTFFEALCWGYTLIKEAGVTTFTPDLISEEHLAGKPFRIPLEVLEEFPRVTPYLRMFKTTKPEIYVRYCTSCHFVCAYGSGGVTVHQCPMCKAMSLCPIRPVTFVKKE